jgi:hypothetical protein
VKVDDCDFSAAPNFPGAEWPPNRPRGVKHTHIADIYVQKPRYVDLGPPTQSERVEIDSGSNGSVRCRIVKETTVTQRVIQVYCVKTFAPLRRKLTWKKVGVGVLVVGAVASLAVPVLWPLHIAALGAAGIIPAVGTAATATGGILALSPSNERPDPRTEKSDTYEETTDETRGLVLRSTAGPWRSCRDTDSTHLECVQHD